MATNLEGGGGGDQAFVAGTKKMTFFRLPFAIPCFLIAAKLGPNPFSYVYNEMSSYS